jgi:hypothetical protein
MTTYNPEFRRYTCCICEDICTGWGNNPEPLMDDRNGTVECCDKCNDKVIAYRMRQMFGGSYGTEQAEA